MYNENRLMHILEYIPDSFSSSNEVFDFFAEMLDIPPKKPKNDNDSYLERIGYDE